MTSVYGFDTRRLGKFKNTPTHGTRIYGAGRIGIDAQGVGQAFVAKYMLPIGAAVVLYTPPLLHAA